MVPSSDTITSTDLPTFSARTLIKSAKMNTALGIWRGHMLPVDASLSAAANNSYDLGSSTYKWRGLFCNSISAAYISAKPYHPMVVTTGAITITHAHHVVILNYAATGTATFPTAVGHTGSSWIVKNVGTVAGLLDGNASETIDGTITMAIFPNQSVHVMAYGGNLIIL